MSAALKVGTEVVKDIGGMDCYGVITAVDHPALGPEFGPTRYTVDWYYTACDNEPMFTSQTTADRIEVVPE